MADNLCSVCRGAGNIGVYPNFWQCGPCGGSGVRVQHGPSVFIRRPLRSMTPVNSYLRSNISDSTPYAGDLGKPR